MDNLLFSPAFTREAFVMLLDYALKGVVILLFANLLVNLLRPASAAIRHAIWGVALLLLMLVPLAPHVVPGLDLAILDPVDLPGGPERSRSDVMVVPEDAQIAYVPSLDASYFMLNRDEEGRAALDEQVAALMGNRVSDDAQIVRIPGAAYLVESPGAGVTPARAEPSMPVLDAVVSFGMTAKWSDWLLLAWLGGVVFLLGWMNSGVVGLFWLRLRSTHLMGEDWQDLIDEISERYALRRPVALMTSGRIAMPMTWGLWRPVVMLPVDAEDWPAERRRSVLLHEVAHIARWDYLTQSLAYAVCAVNWFNPLVWRAAGQMRLEQEKACDDRVLSHGMKASAYASHLMDLARTVRSTFVSPAAAMSMARPSQLEGRLMAILDDRGDRRAPSWRRLVGTVAVAFVLILPLAAMQVWRPAVEVRPVFFPPATTVTPLAEIPPVPAVAPVPTTPLARLVLSATPQPENWDLTRLLTVWSDPDTTDDDHKAARQKAIKALRAALKDENEEIRHDALAALARIGGVDVVDALVEVLQQDPSVDVRYQAVLALSRINSEETVPAFLEALGDDHERIREIAVQALGRQTDDRVVDALAGVLKSDPSREVRISAANGLGRLRDIRAVDALTEAMEDEDVEIRRAAARALSQLNYGEEERVVLYGGNWNTVNPGAALPAEFPVIVSQNAFRADVLRRSVADSSRLWEFQVQSQALQNELHDLARRHKAEAEFQAERSAQRQTELELMSGQALRIEARISELIRVIEEQPATDACREAFEQLEALKDVNPRARIALENLKCEKE